MPTHHAPITMQAVSPRFPLLRIALLASAVVAVCVVVAASSRARSASTLVDFTGTWASEEDDDGYDRDPVVRDSVVGHAKRQLSILRGHLNRRALLAFDALLCLLLTPLPACAAPDPSRALNTWTSACS